MAYKQLKRNAAAEQKTWSRNFLALVKV